MKTAEEWLDEEPMEDGTNDLEDMQLEWIKQIQKETMLWSEIKL